MNFNIMLIKELENYFIYYVLYVNLIIYIKLIFYLYNCKYIYVLLIFGKFILGIVL